MVTTVNSRLPVVCLLIWFGGQVHAEDGPRRFQLGDLRLTPGGFFEAIGMVRSATTPDSVNTHFGIIPLVPTPTDWQGTIRHSRMSLLAELPKKGPFRARLFAEADFLHFSPTQSPYRWRQYWGEVKIGGWEVLGGQAWSLLRPNRAGIASEKDMMNTDVIDPEYHVGLLGFRRRQVRVAHALGSAKVAFAWEEGGLVLGKLALDRGRLHGEVGASVGRGGRGGGMLAEVYKFDKFRIVGQQYWSRRDAAEALAVVPARVNGGAAITGVEIPFDKKYEIYSYGGLVYAARSPGNRLVREWTVGANRTFGRILTSAQVAQMDRAAWSAGQGSMTYLMFRVRYIVN